jgi:hypothetical protein
MCKGECSANEEGRDWQLLPHHLSTQVSATFFSFRSFCSTSSTRNSLHPLHPLHPLIHYTHSSITSTTSITRTTSITSITSSTSTLSTSTTSLHLVHWLSLRARIVPMSAIKFYVHYEENEPSYTMVVRDASCSVGSLKSVCSTLILRGCELVISTNMTMH